MATLSGTKPKNTFSLLAKLAQALDGTLRALQTGAAVDLPIQVSTDGVNLIGFARCNGVSLVDSDGLAEALAALRVPVRWTATAFTAALAPVKTPIASYQSIMPVTVAEGSGPYTAKLCLDTTSAINGALVYVKFTLPAVAGYTFEIRNLNGSGTVLESIGSSASYAQTGGAVLTFNGTAWESLNQTNVRQA